MMLMDDMLCCSASRKTGFVPKGPLGADDNDELDEGSGARESGRRGIRDLSELSEGQLGKDKGGIWSGMRSLATRAVPASLAVRLGGAMGDRFCVQSDKNFPTWQRYGGRHGTESMTLGFPLAEKDPLLGRLHPDLEVRRHRGTAWLTISLQFVRATVLGDGRPLLRGP